MSQIIPEQYMCYRAKDPLTIDGHLTEASWKRARRTPLFVDIEGDKKPLPRFATRVAMLWDDDYFYFGADMEEPHVWGTLTKRDSVICNDNDFEIFIDPDDDGEHYMEFEINPLNVAWDLYLPKQYNRGGKADWGFDFEGIKHACRSMALSIARTTWIGAGRWRWPFPGAAWSNTLAPPVLPTPATAGGSTSPASSGSSTVTRAVI